MAVFVSFRLLGIVGQSAGAALCVGRGSAVAAFSTALSESSNSLIGNSNLISKVYFPLIIPGQPLLRPLWTF
jgi:ABC-type polysaccharide/polyol phosphate export permease